ncbi:hypothetical protein BX666DRAFT_1899414 [Dichotomocladium elegans]|nr:hypothetical protein BX666DRAFT_1899414 [Dichotomocladium elegans]
MEAKFDKIRSQLNSKLENLKLYARTLVAIEDTIREQNAPLSATAYFGAIVSPVQNISTPEEES